MTPEVAMMTCDWCGKQFPADANACVEAGITAYHPGDEWKGPEPLEVGVEDFGPEEVERMKSEMEVDDKELRELLATGKVDGLASIVCLECQENALRDSE